MRQHVLAFMLIVGVAQMSAPTDAHAQSCHGLSLGDRGLTVTVSGDASRHAAGWGGGATGVVGGFMSIDAGTRYARVAGFSSRSRGYSLRLSGIIGDGRFQSCPYVALHHDRLPFSHPMLQSGTITNGTTSLSELRVPVGWALGGEIEVGRGASITPYAAPHFLFSALNSHASAAPLLVEPEPRVGFDTGFGLGLGLSVATRHLIVSLEWSGTTFEPSNHLAISGSDLTVNLDVPVW